MSKSTGAGRSGEGKTRRRRKDARPTEIVDAALQVFLEFGFDATKLDEVARRAGVAKGTLYLYFETKEQLFRSVLQGLTSTGVHPLREAVAAFDGPFDQLVAMLLRGAAEEVGNSKVPAVAKLILRESGRFPDLARIWFEEVVSPMLGTIREAVERGQGRGEVQPGDSTAHTYSILGPMLAALLSKELFGPLGFSTVDPRAVAVLHSETLSRGLLSPRREGPRRQSKR